MLGMKLGKKLGAGAVALVLALGLAACGDEPDVAEAPAPQEPSSAAIGYYCGMNVAEHDGPKGQLFLAGEATPLWFSSVRDTLAFTRLPEEPKTVTAIYVNDMGKAKTWATPEAGAWVEARAAVYVIGSDARGGMGAPEAVPFSERAAAEAFMDAHGGRIFAFDEVPEDFVLGEIWNPEATSGQDAQASHDEQSSHNEGGEASHAQH
jgi:copper chaperone NosL